jgi:hypothetical protein
MTILLRLCDREGYMKFIFMDVINAYFSAMSCRETTKRQSENVGVIAN